MNRFRTLLNFCLRPYTMVGGTGDTKTPARPRPSTAGSRVARAQLPTCSSTAALLTLSTDRSGLFASGGRPGSSSGRPGMAVQVLSPV